MPTLRKKNRLEKWLYNAWWFFVTICIQDKISYFSDIDIGADSILLNGYWKIIESCRLNISSIYKKIKLWEFIIMPNHVHAIVFIDNETNKVIDNRPYGILSKIIKWFKQTTSKQLHESWLKTLKRQKSFYDHVIRNEKDLQRIQEYI